LVILLVISGVAVRTLGLEFLPKLEEGNLWIRATMPTSKARRAKKTRRLFGFQCDDAHRFAQHD
jgi:cobalt-zinc-cadmium resistance protein CzcA